MKRDLLIGFLIFSGALLVTSSCSEDESRPTFPLSAEIFQSAVGKQVAFNALTHGATSWSWDFGDGKTSTEQNPVHVYEEGGYYVATLTASDGKSSVTKEVSLALDLPAFALLVGDHTKDGYAGKTWKLSSDHEPLGDYFANADASLSTVSGTPRPLSSGIFGSIGFGDAYTDEFTFHHNESYSINTGADEAVFGGLVFHTVTVGAGNILAGSTTYGLSIAKYTPDDEATFTLEEGDNLDVATVHGGLSFENVMTLDFSGTAFLGFRDFQRKIILRSISSTRMQVLVFMAAAPNPLGVNTHALFLTLEAVN